MSVDYESSLLIAVFIFTLNGRIVASSPKAGYLPTLDGWRAIAIVAENQKVPRLCSVDLSSAAILPALQKESNGLIYPSE